MKKEILFVITICLFLLAYALDYFAGSLNLGVLTPLAFLNKIYFNTYPMTFVAVITRSIALMLSITLILSAVEKQYFTKLGISAFLAFIAEIYAFQQMATGVKITPTLWTLAISYGGAMLIVPMFFYVLAGIANFLIPNNKNEVHFSPSEPNTKTSVLNP